MEGNIVHFFSAFLTSPKVIQCLTNGMMLAPLQLKRTVGAYLDLRHE